MHIPTTSRSIKLGGWRWRGRWLRRWRRVWPLLRSPLGSMWPVRNVQTMCKVFAQPSNTFQWKTMKHMEVFQCIHAHSNHFQKHQVGVVAVAGAVAAAVAAALAVAVAVAAAALGVAGVGGCALFYGALWGPCGRYGM